MTDRFKLKYFSHAIDEITNKDLLINHTKPLLKECRDTLFKDYLNGSSAAKIVTNYTQFIDHLIRHAWHTHELDQGNISLLAVGGYGRSELHPYSDIDLLIGSISPVDECLQEKISEFIRLLWDIGLEVGHSVRTNKESIRLAKKDITVLTTLMESRVLVDNQDLMLDLLSHINNEKFWPAHRYTKAKILEQQHRHHAFDETEHNLEPNIKDGPGGLRDIQTIVWVAGRHFHKIDLSVLTQENILTSQESQTLIRGRNFLWKLRIGLHFHAKRKQDRLLFDHQRSLATDFGYLDNDNNLAVEVLMKRYYRTAKDIRLLNASLIQYFQESGQKSKLRPKSINPRFNSVNGYIEAANESVFTQHPPALLEIFHLLQKNTKLKGVRANTIRLISNSLTEVGTKIKFHQESKTIFLNILRYPSGQTHALRSMDAYGVLAAFFPAYNRIVGQMQHDLFHVYTVDTHSLFVLRNLRRFCLAKHKHEETEAYNVMSQVTKRERLYLAALLHDIAKGRGGDHSVLGEKESHRFCKYLELSEHDSKFIAWLVRNHLIMSWTAQRKDISDPEVIKSFAQQVGDQQHLNCLYLLTIADIKATSPKVWNRWKGKLLWDLYISTSRMLSQNLPASEDIKIRIDETKLVVHRKLEKVIANEIIESFWQSLDPAYFLHFSTDAIYWQQAAILSAYAHEIPIVIIKYNMDLEANQILVYAPEKDDLLPIISGAIDHLHLSIINAQIERLKNSMSLLSFVVTDQFGEAIKDNTTLLVSQRYLKDQLRLGKSNLKPKKRILSRRSKHFPIQSQVRFTHSDNGNLTIMEIIAQDRPGLLYHITNALLENKIHLHTARVNTLGERVEDHFFITDRDGHQITNKNVLNKLENSILAALATEDSL